MAVARQALAAPDAGRPWALCPRLAPTLCGLCGRRHWNQEPEPGPEWTPGAVLSTLARTRAEGRPAR